MNAVTAEERGQLPGASVVIPVLSSGEIPGVLCASLAPVAAATGTPLAVILVNDGGRDSSWDVIRRPAATTPGVRGIDLLRNYGRYDALLSAGLRLYEACGFKVAATEAWFHSRFHDRD